jgi:hypothetical protein
MLSKDNKSVEVPIGTERIIKYKTMKTLTEFSSVFIKNAYKIRGEFINTRRVELQKEAQKEATEKAEQAKLMAEATPPVVEAMPEGVVEAVAEETTAVVTVEAATEESAEAVTAEPAVSETPVQSSVDESDSSGSSGAKRRPVEKVTKIIVDPSLLLKPGERHAQPEDPKFRTDAKRDQSNAKSPKASGPKGPLLPRIMVPEEEIEKHLAEALKLEGDKLTHIKNALSVIDPKRAEDLKRVIVLAAAEVTAEAPGQPKTSAQKIGEHYYLAEYMPSLNKGGGSDRNARSDSRGGDSRGGRDGKRGGKRGDKRGGPGGGGRGNPREGGRENGRENARENAREGGRPGGSDRKDGPSFGGPRKPRGDVMPAKSNP